jgi:Ser/Thr protein kinase RdoA (MazF antagonist)
MTTSFEIRTLVREGRREEAAAAAARLLSEETGTRLSGVAINDDRYSLNSVNGTAVDEQGRKLFFKFHTEEGEAETVGEYYRAHVLAEAGLPVDLPLKASSTPGRQFLLYAHRDDSKLADVCLKLEAGQGSDPAPRRRLGLTPFSPDEIVAAQADLDDATLSAALKSLAAPTPASAGEAIHQLFHHRLVTPGETGRLGGRYAQFYQGHQVAVGATEMPWEAFADLRWAVNGVSYRHTLRELFERSFSLLHPQVLARLPVLVSHGDAHNANVWARRDPSGRLTLVLFDPAFAGKAIPALLGEVKATFHNIFAHPLWLYTPDLAERAYRVSAELDGGRIVVTHDWSLSELRRQFLQLKLERYWRPLLLRLKGMGALPDDWEAILRCALFCCPTLVMSQLAGPGRTPSVSLLGFAVATMCGSAPEGTASDTVSEFFAQLRRALA